MFVRQAVEDFAVLRQVSCECVATVLPPRLPLTTTTITTCAHFGRPQPLCVHQLPNPACVLCWTDGRWQVPAPEQMLESLWDTESDEVFDEVRVIGEEDSRQMGLWLLRVCVRGKGFMCLLVVFVVFSVVSVDRASRLTN